MKSGFYAKLKNLSPKASYLIAVPAGMVLVASVIYGTYNYDLVQKENLEILAELDSVNQKNLELLDEVGRQRETIESFEGQLSQLGNTLGNLEKLSKTDEELLQKYSKVYFLNENYRPAKLSTIEKKYLYNKDDAYIHLQVLPYLERMLNDARGEGIDLLVASAFRSFEQQAALKNEYKVIYGAGTANQFSADQGYSEHQLGTSVDLTTGAIGGNFSKFESDGAYKWLLDNAYRYGFIISYPKGNTYYKFEPWHWRFVGADLAKRLYIDKENFYDLGQREIDEYLIKLFD